MSHVESSTSSAPDTLAIPATPPASKPASKDRLFVRSLIGALLIVLSIEAVAYIRSTSTHRQLLNELQKGERESRGTTRERIDAIVGRPPDENHVVKAAVGEGRYDVYYFGGLLKRRELCVHYGVSGIKAEPEVIDVLTVVPEDARTK